ncbi:SdpI family protein [Winogradskyella eckloniae]|uniref:SdpI family protein n=1 Tax=Winogradskyella eckloniae TaxID=1089306 RepID=UPI0015631E3A|nr:SdpI family protein [Winogradskyella eckloniae]NRD19664.1 SdpI family protein [Winogradskyella eckloniae]
MITDNPLFIIPFSTGLIFLVIGFIMLKFPPKKINTLYGYRTVASMKSQKRWDFSQIYSAKEMIKIGVVLLLFSSIGCYVFPAEKIAMLLGLAFLILAVIILIFRVENKLKSQFSNEE